MILHFELWEGLSMNPMLRIVQLGHPRVRPAAEDALCHDTKKMPKVNIYGAGPPCQGVSTAGKKRGLAPSLQHESI